MEIQLTHIEEQTTKCLSLGQSIIITSQETYDIALEYGKKVSKLLKIIDEDEKKITKPINDSLKMIRDKYRPYKEQVEAVKKDVSGKMSAYIRQEDEKKRIEAERIAKRIEKGTMREDTAINKLAVAEETKTQTNGSMTSVLVLTVLDKSKIPVEYMIVDESKIKDAYRKGINVEGTKCEYEKRARL